MIRNMLFSIPFYFIKIRVSGIIMGTDSAGSVETNIL
jgi:hypothetical protein